MVSPFFFPLNLFFCSIIYGLKKTDLSEVELCVLVHTLFIFLISRRRRRKEIQKMSRPSRYMSPGDCFDEPEELCGNVPLGCRDGEFSQLTKLRSAPHRHQRRVLPEETRSLVSPVHMMIGRECNFSGRGRFSLSDSCHVLSRYLPVHSTPHAIDKMKSCAYVSQFSDDGSLFVAGFQVLETILLYI